MPSLWFWHLGLLPNPLCRQFQDWSVVVAFVVLLFLIAGRRSMAAPGRWSSDRVAVLLVLAMAFVVSLWNWPVADDWSWAVACRGAGGFPVVVDSYLEWTGRYAAYAVQAPYGWLIDPVVGSIAWSWILILWMMAAGAFALRPSLPASRAGQRVGWVLSAAGTAVWIATMEWPGHGLFWFSATTTYAIALPLMLTAIGVAQRADRRPATMVLLGALLGVVLGGLGESAALAAWALIAGACLRAWLLRLPSRWCWSAMLGAISVGLLANGFSPGTAHRASVLADGAGFDRPREDLSLGVRGWGWLLRCNADAAAWLTSPIVLCAGLASVPVVQALTRRLRREEASGVGVLAAWCLVPGVVMAGYLPAFAIFGHAPPWRARDAVQGLVLIVAFAAWVRTVAWIRRRGGDPTLVIIGLAGAVFMLVGLSWAAVPRSDPQTLLMGLSLLAAVTATVAFHRRRRVPLGSRSRRCGGTAFAAALLLLGSFPSLTADAVVNGPRWRAYQEGVAKILTAGAGRDVEVPRDVWADRPQHLWYWGIGSDPATWRNRAVADWYGVASVRTGEAPDLEESPE